MIFVFEKVVLMFRVGSRKDVELFLVLCPGRQSPSKVLEEEHSRIQQNQIQIFILRQFVHQNWYLLKDLILFISYH